MDMESNGRNGIQPVAAEPQHLVITRYDKNVTVA